MSGVTRKEFQRLCRISNKDVISVNIKRGNLIESVDVDGVRRLELSHPLNKAFLKKYEDKYRVQNDAAYREQKARELKEKALEAERKAAEKLEAKTAKLAKNAKVAKAHVTKKSESQSTNSDEPTTSAPFSEDQEGYEDWPARKRKADALLQEAKAEKERLAVEKVAGQLLPLDLTLQIIQIHNRDIFATFQNDVENLASEFCDRLAGGDRKALAELTARLSAKLEDSIKRAADVAQASIESVIDEYSETRNRGERK